MEQLTQQKADFIKQRADYLANANQLTELENEKQKTQAILTALHNELVENIAKAKEKLNQPNSLTADDYVAMKSQDSGLKARIEYYQAFIEELELKIYQCQEQLYFDHNELYKQRGKILAQLAENMLISFNKQHKAELEEIANYLYLSGTIEPNPAGMGNKGTLDYAVLQYLSEKIISAIDISLNINDKYNLVRVTGEFKPKRPTEKYAESFSQSQKGFQKLINNLTE